MPLMTEINERRPNPEREEKTLSEGVLADMGNLARILKEPAQYMTPGVGDYMAHQDATEKYGKARDAFKRGDYLQAVLYGGGGLGDDLTVIPGIGDIAMAGKGMGSIAAGLIGSTKARVAEKVMDNDELFIAFERYDNTGEDTIEDLVDQVDYLISEDLAPKELQAAVDRFKKEQQEDFFEYGMRGDMQGEEESFADKVQAILNK